MTTPHKHVQRILDEIRLMHDEKHISESNELIAANDIELAVFQLQKAFEYSNKLDKE